MVLIFWVDNMNTDSSVKSARYFFFVMYCTDYTLVSYARTHIGIERYCRRHNHEPTNQQQPQWRRQHFHFGRERKWRENNTVINVNTHIQFKITKSKRDFMGTTPAEYLAVGKCNDTNWNIPPYSYIYLLQYACLSECIVFCKQVQATRVLQIYSPKFEWLMPFCILWLSLILSQFWLHFQYHSDLVSVYLVVAPERLVETFETILMRKNSVPCFFFFFF